MKEIISSTYVSPVARTISVELNSNVLNVTSPGEGGGSEGSTEEPENP